MTYSEPMLEIFHLETYLGHLPSYLSHRSRSNGGRTMYHQNFKFAYRMYW